MESLSMYLPTEGAAPTPEDILNANAEAALLGDKVSVTDSREELLLMAMARIKLRIMAAREDPVEFISFVLRSPKGETLVSQDFHRKWLELFATGRRVQIEAAKSHGKTTSLLGLILWLIGRNPDIRIKLFAQSEEKARERISVVANTIISSKLYQLVFPHIKKSSNPQDPWHKTGITIERNIKDPNATLEGSGITGSVEGGRADLVVLDDVCDHRSSMMYPLHRAAIVKKCYAEVLPMLESDGRAISIATPHHDADLVASLRRNPEWDAHIYAVGGTKENGEDDPFQPLWPDRWSRESLEKLMSEVGVTEYNRAYRCQAQATKIEIIKPEHIVYYDRNMLGDPWNLICLQGYDLAITDKKGASFFACVTLLYNAVDDLVFVADAWQDRLDFAAQAQSIVQQAATWNPDRIILEETGYQRALREYLQDIARSTLPLWPVSPGNKSKELRLTETLPLFETDRIFFNPSLKPDSTEVQRRGDLVTQLINFTMSTEQDLGDAFAHVVNGTRAFREAYEEGVDWRAGGGVSTRLSILGR
jgi:hypothetical protein